MLREVGLIGALVLLAACEGSEGGESATADRAGVPADRTPKFQVAVASQTGAGATPALSAAMAALDCKPIQFPRGASSAVVGGAVPGYYKSREEPIEVCYMLAVGDGQHAEVRLLNSPNVGISIPDVDDMQEAIAFTTRRGTYRILLNQVIPEPSSFPFRMRVAVSALAPGPARGSGAAGSCTAEIGAQAAAILVQQCKQASPATHPPCHADNPCAMIRDEIERGCGQYPGTRPRFCAGGGASTAAGTGGAPTGNAWLVGAWGPVEYGGCSGHAGLTFNANGTFRGETWGRPLDADRLAPQHDYDGDLDIWR